MKFPWPAFRVIFGELSAIDMPQLELANESEAHQFLLSYGYDLFEPSHVEQVWKIYAQAVSFIDQRLCVNGPKVPVGLKNKTTADDFKQLLLAASGSYSGDQTELKENKLWVCAILRVMHAIAHLQSDLRLKYLPKIKRQTVDRLEAHVQRVKDGNKEKLFLGYEKDKVALVHFHKKEAKVKDSVLLKLLQKANQVAHEIYDHLGVRFVTETRAEAFWVIQYLLQHHLVSFTNIMPMRSRNTLASFSDFRAVVENLSTSPDFKELDKKLGVPPLDSSIHPFSAKDYHSIQFTSRPLIRIPTIRKGVRSEMSFFFPVEVQIMDNAAFEASQRGAANHVQYKQKQLEAVRQRVLRGLLS